MGRCVCGGCWARTSEPAGRADVIIPACSWGSPGDARASACRCVQLFETPALAQPQALAPWPRAGLSPGQHSRSPTVGDPCPAGPGTVRWAVEERGLQRLNQELGGICELGPGWDLPRVC